MGHYHPLVPLARAAGAAGHEVAFATGDPFRSSVEDAGFTAFSAGLSVDRWQRELSDLGLERLARTDYRPFFFGRVFTDLEVPARLSDLLRIVELWRPDVLVHGVAEFAGPLAAALAQIPHATCGFGPLLQPEIAKLAGEAVGRHWQAAGLDPGDGRMYRSLYLDPCPPGLQVCEIAELKRTLQIRPESPEQSESESPLPWLMELPDRPTVYLTLGTVFNRDLEVFSRVLEGLEGKDVNVIATVGPDRDPDALGPQPANIRLFGYVPQAQLLGRCDLVICHGGASSTFGALSFGLPLLILPRGADNFYNAERVLSAGAGRSLLDDEITAEAVGNEVAFLLTDDDCHNAAALIAGEITAMPAPARAVTSLENLAAMRPSSPSASRELANKT